MNPVRATTQIILLLSAGILHFTAVDAQLSRRLLQYLPENCLPQPRNKCKLEAAEISRIFQYAKAYVTPALTAELDSLGAVWIRESHSETNDSVKIAALGQLTSFSLNANNYDAAAKYCSLLLDQVRGKRQYNALKYSYEKTRGGLFASAGAYEKSIGYFNDCLEQAKKENDSAGIAEIYSGLSYPYAILGLYERCVECLDSSLAYFGPIENEQHQFYALRQDVLVNKCGRYLNLYEKTGNRMYGQLAAAMISNAFKNKNHHYLYDIFPAGKAYLDGDYLRSLTLCDSILASLSTGNPPHRQAFTTYLNRYKALDLMALNRAAEAVPLLKELIAFYLQKKGASSNANANIIRFSEKLYTYYQGIQQWPAAYQYLEMNKMYSDSLNLLENRGRLFELEQKYNFAKKEARLTSLENSNIISRKQITLAISTGVIAVLCMIVTALLLYFRNRQLALKKKLVEKESEMKIDRLLFVSQLHIAELEEKNKNIKREEQRKMGMELHDDVGASLACILLRLRTLTTKLTDVSCQDEFGKLVLLTAGVYESVREKSHHWYNMTPEVVNFSFADSIHHLLNTCLPENIYEKEVMVDSDALVKASMDIKMELMHIIREAVANIIKHAEAQKITVLIYEDAPGLILSVADNGKGFAPSAISPGMGLSSITSRSESIGGTAEIISGKKGTEIKVTLPL